MAEIRVQPKRRSMVWLWLLLLVAVVAAVLWYLNSQGVTLIQVRQGGATSAAPTAAPAPPARAG